VVLLIGGSPLLRAVAADAVALLTPASQSIAVNQVTTITLHVQDVGNLYGYQVAIVFNPDVLKVIDADPGKAGIQVALGTFLQADFVQQNNADNSVGTVICVVSQLAPASPVSGSGDLLTVTFQGKAQGSSDIRFTDLKLARSDGTEIAVSQQNAQITVGSGTSPTATSTSTSTPTATPTVTATPTSTSTTPTPTSTYAPPTATPTVTPTASPTSTPAPGQTVIYVVRSGDTLYSLSRRFGVSVQVLMQVNGISNPNYIQVGQKLTIPGSGYVTPTPSPSPATYVVQRGDTLYSIARRYGTTVGAIALANRIANPSLIFAGQKLVIPGASTPPPSDLVHVVQAGETLSSIARRYGTTYWAIAIANNLANPNVIYPGQRLIIP